MTMKIARSLGVHRERRANGKVDYSLWQSVDRSPRNIRFGVDLFAGSGGFLPHGMGIIREKENCV